MPETGWLLSNRSFSLFWRAGSLRNRVPAWLGAGGNPSSRSRLLSWLCAHLSPGVRAWVCLIRALHPHHVITPVSLAFRCCRLRWAAKEFGWSLQGSALTDAGAKEAALKTRVELALEFWETGEGLGRLEVVLIESSMVAVGSRVREIPTRFA